MIDMSYLKPAVTVNRALDSWPNPPNIEEVREAMCALLDQAPVGWVQQRKATLTDIPDQVIHAGSGPQQKLSVQWRGEKLYFYPEDARALAQTVPDPGYAWH